jgi:hypothetical protein
MVVEDGGRWHAEAPRFVEPAGHTEEAAVGTERRAEGLVGIADDPAPAVAGIHCRTRRNPADCTLAFVAAAAAAVFAAEVVAAAVASAVAAANRVRDIHPAAGVLWQTSLAQTTNTTAASPETAAVPQGQPQPLAPRPGTRCEAPHLAEIGLEMAVQSHMTREQPREMPGTVDCRMFVWRMDSCLAHTRGAAPACPVRLARVAEALTGCTWAAAAQMAAWVALHSGFPSRSDWPFPSTFHRNPGRNACIERGRSVHILIDISPAMTITSNLPVHFLLFLRPRDRR